MTFDNLIIADHDKTRIVTINRPQVLNALNKKTLLELEQAFVEIDRSSDIRAVIVTGAGEKGFVAGADIAEMKDLSPTEAEQFSKIGHHVFDMISHARVPVVAAVNGFALGGGLELALACDFIYASANASFGLVETKLALIPGFGGVARLTRRVGEARAKEMIFSAAIVKADEALRIGIANSVVPEGKVLEAALTVASKMGARGPYAVALAKGLIRDGQDADMRTANAMEQRCFGLVFGSKDHIEGINSFLEKRDAVYEGH